ncbi:hypothetical protein LguiA_029570 [Lonicera macranthoides]
MAMLIKSRLLFFSFISTILLMCLPNVARAVVTYNVLSFGAKGDGVRDSTGTFLKAWASACSSTQLVTIYVPKGRYLLKNVEFRGPCKSKIKVQIDGTLVAPLDYNAVGKSRSWILFIKVNRVSVVGGGTLDGQGTNLWSCKNSGKNCPNGATSLGFYNSNNIVVNGLTSLNSQKFHISIYACRNAMLQGTKIMAAGNSPNTDGIHVQLSTSVSILNSVISTGDDCISIGPGNSNLWIENVACGPGHGISIGSLGWDLQEPGVQNVTVKTVTFKGTQNGVRIKTWARASNGFVKSVLFQQLVMVNVQNPIIIDQNYCPNNKNCPGQVSGIKISDIMYQDIHGTSATAVAVNFDCSKKYPCSNIKLVDVNLSYKDQTAQASCSNVGGTSSGVVKPSSCL